MGNDEIEAIRRRRIKELFQRSFSKVDGEMSKPIEITDATFVETIKKHPFVVVDCWAAWCAPCRILAPILEELAKDYAGKMLFAKLNVDANQEVAINYQVMSIPTLLVFKNGKLVDRIIGALPKQIIEQKLISQL